MVDFFHDTEWPLRQKSQHTLAGLIVAIRVIGGGAEEDRTPDARIAN